MVRLELTELSGREPERLERRSEAESGTKRIHSVRSRYLNPDGSGIGFAKKLVRSIKIRTTSLSSDNLVRPRLLADVTVIE